MGVCGLVDCVGVCAMFCVVVLFVASYRLAYGSFCLLVFNVVMLFFNILCGNLLMMNFLFLFVVFKNFKCGILFISYAFISSFYFALSMFNIIKFIVFLCVVFIVYIVGVDFLYILY